MASSHTKIIRECKDGGYSPCSASEENVGKRRCTHINGGSSFKAQFNKLSNKVEELVVPEDYIKKIEKEDKEEIVRKFVTNLEPMDKKMAEQVLNKVRRDEVENND